MEPVRACPIGVQPQWNWIERNPRPTKEDFILRLAALQDAVGRYESAENFRPQQEWLDEILKIQAAGVGP